VIRLLFAVLAAVPSLAGACQAQAAPPAVVWFGDSNVAMVAGKLDGTVHATPGYSLDDWFAEMATVPPGAVIVVALGSNDVLEGDVDGDVVEAARLLSRRCVVWVTPAQSSFDALGEPYASSARGLIAELGQQAHVVVWDTALFQPADPVHLTEDGYEAYTSVLASAPEACG
jgi:hypothetical protein